MYPISYEVGQSSSKFDLWDITREQTYSVINSLWEIMSQIFLKDQCFDCTVLRVFTMLIYMLNL